MSAEERSSGGLGGDPARTAMSRQAKSHER
jgi:hypothetical protein